MRLFVQNIEGRTHAEANYELHAGEYTGAEQINDLQNDTIHVNSPFVSCRALPISTRRGVGARRRCRSSQPIKGLLGLRVKWIGLDCQVIPRAGLREAPDRLARSPEGTQKGRVVTVGGVGRAGQERTQSVVGFRVAEQWGGGGVVANQGQRGAEAEDSVAVVR